MATTEETLIFVKDLIGKEDILFGEGEVQQIRDGEVVLVSMVNAETIPYRTPAGELITVKAALDYLYAQSEL
jgi:hypothetical protein